MFFPNKPVANFLISCAIIIVLTLITGLPIGLSHIPFTPFIATEEQVYVQKVLGITLSSISSAASFAFVVYTIWKKGLTTLNSRLAVCVVGSIGLVNLAQCISTVVIDPSDCHFLSFFTNTLCMTFLLYGFCFHFVLLERIVHKTPMDDLLKMEKYYHLFSWAIPLISGVVLLATKLYGKAGVFCYISFAHTQWQFMLLYSQVFAVLIYTCVVIVTISRLVGKHSLSSSSAANRSDTIGEKVVFVKFIVYMVGYMTLWLLQIVYRIVLLADSSSLTFGLLVMNSTGLNLQGFVASLLFTFVYTIPYKREENVRSQP